MTEETPEFYETARRLVVRYQHAYISFLQQRMHLGFKAASRLMDMLEERGVVSPPAANGKRTVLIKWIEPVEDKWVVRKGGYFYRPNAHGYTNLLSQAGAWPFEEAKGYINDDPFAVVTIHPLEVFADRVEPGSPDQTILSLRARVAALEAVLAPFVEAAFAASKRQEEAKRRSGILSDEVSTGLGIRFKHLFAARDAVNGGAQ